MLEQEYPIIQPEHKYAHKCPCWSCITAWVHAWKVIDTNWILEMLAKNDKIEEDDNA